METVDFQLEGNNMVVNQDNNDDDGNEALTLGDRLGQPGRKIK